MALELRAKDQKPNKGRGWARTGDIASLQADVRAGLVVACSVWRARSFTWIDVPVLLPRGA